MSYSSATGTKNQFLVGMGAKWLALRWNLFWLWARSRALVVGRDRTNVKSCEVQNTITVNVLSLIHYATSMSAIGDEYEFLLQNRRQQRCCNFMGYWHGRFAGVYPG